ncbi:nicotinate (nicotinamide) nucleotide adenylyltransferase [Helicobacter suis]|uniref:nicotinate (nicotinamide) nucleotide adenylyltransferase n=1 Tax=Helicobacter suis TaxID=104628 RepID=UPI000CF1808B|nr:nicotinate (nicotinamide) nucleotide adenylyltransferase [Helicobacter suis]
MDIALYGGSFDPPHIAHLEVIYQALETLKVDRLFVLVAYQNPFKKSPCFAPNQRLLWMQELLKDLAKVKVHDFEIKQKRPVPSIESVRYFYQKFTPNKLYFLIGADNVAGLALWEGYTELKELVEFVVVERKGYVLNPPADFKYTPMSLEHITCPISSSKIRELLHKHQIPQHLPHMLQSRVLQTFKETHAY